MIDSFIPYANKRDVIKYSASPLMILFRNSILYTESYIMLSGLLTSHSYFGQMKKGRKINIFKEYLGRYLRLFPSMGALMLFATFLFPLMGSGPLWNIAVTKSSEICQKTWWYNIFLIQNFLDFDKICLYHTYHVAVDTQLFVIAPFIIIFVWKWPKQGIFSVILLVVFSSVTRFVSVNIHQTDNFIPYGTRLVYYITYRY
jgi:peptidoglycan/LPS O-acetylase OafA/YrhL